ncbi:aspartate kinase [Haliangium ochraceum]|uniref:aspartate kinase n=1 Tax=Haliangium ochraceum (strain DSM 14365 / JCM 11303 / SMP-2) TaxID=502025 RepID=D0LLE6_HALO1|nr:aspartate kinase [Haliangium ochraceum]ACY18642.1 Aspartate kinase [Haliangium ochraceum DSM 14365]
MTLRVCKFGGSTFLENADYRRVAEFLGDRLARDADGLVVVVSAMAGLTERLRGLATELAPAPSAEACDALLPLADALSANLLRIALEGCGVSVTSLSGFQSGVRSDDNFSRARLTEVDPGPLRRALAQTSVVVVPGGQAVDQHHRPTMLGKNSSDLTAVVLAAALGRDECEIFSDVCGVFSADPNLVEHSRLCAELSYEAAMALGTSGAKVLHPKSVAAGRDHGVRIVCRANRGDYRVGTVVGAGATPSAVVIDPRSQVLAFHHDEALAAAETHLLAVDVPLLRVTHEGRTLLVVVGGFFDAVGFLGRLDIEAHLEDAHLVSVFEPARAVRREIVPREAAVARGREWHRKLYADAPVPDPAAAGAAPRVDASVQAGGATLLGRVLPEHSTVGNT